MGWIFVSGGIALPDGKHLLTVAEIAKYEGVDQIAEVPVEARIEKL
jgi:hypothetical protein